MNRKYFTAVVLLSLVAITVAQAQRRDNSRRGRKPEAAVVPSVPMATVFLGTSMLSSGEISDRVFDSLVMQRLTARDSAGNAVTVTDFNLTLAERGIFEDSAGNPMLVVDYTREICTGDTLTPFLRNVLPEHTKPGDTVWIENITAVNAAGKRHVGKTMKFVIAR
jgi:hypothetical protein